jgi:FKBP-type peptidyl-prolyl cis-trans isomerase
MTRIRLLGLALLAVGFTACLDATNPQYATVEGTTFDSSLGVDLSASQSTDVGVYYRDITVGTGADITPGQDTYMFYHAYLSNGFEFDSTQPPKPPAAIRTGTGTLIPGFEIGLQGMKVGGRRQILVPPALAYRLADVRDPNNRDNILIPGNSVLVFVVDLVNADGSPVVTSSP